MTLCKYAERGRDTQAVTGTKGTTQRKRAANILMFYSSLFNGDVMLLQVSITAQGHLFFF